MMRRLTAGLLFFLSCGEGGDAPTDSGVDAAADSGGGPDEGSTKDLGSVDLGAADGPSADGSPDGGAMGCGWQRVFGGTGTGGVLTDEAWDVAVLSDGTIVAVGHAESTTGDLTGLTPGGWALRLSAGGDVMWSRTYGSVTIRSVIESAAGNLVFAGNALAMDACPNFSGTTDGWIAQVDVATGDADWTHCIGGTVEDEAADVAEVPGVGFRILGRTRSHNSGNVGPNHSNGAYDALYGFVTDGAIPDPHGQCFGTGSGAPEAGVAFMGDVMVATTWGGAEDDLAGQTVYGSQDLWFARVGAEPCGPCALTDVLRVGGDLQDQVFGVTASGFLGGETQSLTGPLACPGGPSAWIGRYAAGAFNLLVCVGVPGDRVFGMVDSPSGPLWVGRTSRAVDWPTADVSGTPGGADALIVAMDAEGDAVRWSEVLGGPNSMTSEWLRSVAVTSDGCIVGVGNYSDRFWVVARPLEP